MIPQDFFRAGSEIAVVAKHGGELRRILLCDAGHRAEENRETDREDTLFTARENAPAKIKSAQSGFFDRRGTEIVSDKANLFGLFRGGGDGFAELSEAEHGGRPVSHGAERGRILKRKIALAWLR
jgi:hypothetical protein